MRKNSDKYDFIIYGATVFGITAAVKLAGAGKSVILINHFGFPGGSLTESLNCFQKLIPFRTGTAADNIIECIKSVRHGLINLQGNMFFVDAEMAKISFQNFLESKNIFTLYHVKAHELEFDGNNRMILTLSGKEGTFRLSGSTVIDATEDNYLAAVSGLFNIAMTSIYLNLIISGCLPEEAVTEINPNKYYKITERRSWISVKVNETSGENSEAAAQKSADRIEEILRKYKTRIQILPAALHRTAIDVRKQNIPLPSGFLLWRDIIEKHFEPDELFSAASEIEAVIFNKTGII